MNDENGDMVRESECRRPGAVCSEDRSEDIEIDGETLTAYFCSKTEDATEDEEDSDEISEDDSADDFDIRSKICDRLGRPSGGRRGQGHDNRRQQISWFNF